MDKRGSEVEMGELQEQAAVWRMGFCQRIALLGDDKAKGMSGPSGKKGKGHWR